MKLPTLPILLLVLSLVGTSHAEVPAKFQKRILSYAPGADADGDGKVSTDELQKVYPTLPMEYQQLLSMRLPELAAGGSAAPGGEGGNRTALSFKRPAGSPEEGRKKGFNCLFLGHSYFVPIVMQIEQHARSLGLENHQQHVIFNGGPKGSPGLLWDNPISTPAKDLLRTGNVELVAMTAHYTGSELDDYSRWVDLALQHNPKTIFIIQSPWAQKQEKQLPEYTGEIGSIIQKTAGVIDQLREKYPETVFLRVAQAQWMLSLWQLYEEGKLPGLTTLIAPNRSDAGNALFRDQHGHGGDLAVNGGVLLWLRVLYGIDLKSYEAPKTTSQDLKALAQQIVDEDPYSTFPQK